jgi:hypothetical protein
MSETVCPFCHRPDGAGHTIVCISKQALEVLAPNIEAGAKYLTRQQDDIANAWEQRLAQVKANSILQEAESLVNGDRHEAYGAAAENFSHWRDMCRATGRPGLAGISAEDLAVAMICLKVCRNTVKYKRDSTVDGAAYFELWDQVQGL